MSDGTVRHLRREGGSNVTGITLEGEAAIMELTISLKARPTTTYQYPLAQGLREESLYLFEKMGRILREEG